MTTKEILAKLTNEEVIEIAILFYKEEKENASNLLKDYLGENFQLQEHEYLEAVNNLFKVTKK